MKAYKNKTLINTIKILELGEVLMVIIQARSKRKSTGGRYKSSIVKKRMTYKGNLPTMTKLGERRTKLVQARGFFIRNM